MSPTQDQFKASGFTVVEMLVSMAILIMLLAMVTVMINSASRMTVDGGKHMDADSQARLIFDRMAIDIARMVKRADVDYWFQQNKGNDAMAFYSESTGYSPAGTSGGQVGSASLVGYMITPDPAKPPQLMRLSKALVWNGVTAAGATPMVFGTSAAGAGKLLTSNWPQIADGTDPDYQVIADQVYRLEFNFLLKPYTDASGKLQASIISVTPWDARQSHTALNGMGDVSAIMVALGILDNTSRKIVESTQYAGMIKALPEASGSSSILQTWNSSNYLSVTQGLIPKASAAQVRTYQRCFFLNQAP